MIWGRATFLVVLGPLAFVNANESRTRAQQTTIPISDGIAADPHGPNICEARTINYITHTLPQSCLTTSWASPHPLSSTYAGPVGSDGVRESITTFTSDPTVSEAHTAEATATTFMSFEDWKEMMLRRAGQDPQEWRSRKPSDHTPDDRYLPDMGDAGLGEEDEISLDFDSYRYQSGDDKKGDMTGSAEANDDRNSHDAQAYGDGKAATIHRSKDAGKTCKERFSYSSFDAGATILKTAAGAKNARAILVENKDSYMLLECAAPTKYVIFELSDDILVDTIVIANFEFFSSMIRLFRVSVSDRYPVKTERWRELGTFEARNSRDIQPFLVDNPQIWAKYVRIEFLTHYGNEYYCPVSLVRVHGSRMLDSWKDSETGRDEDSQIEGERSAAQPLIQGDAVPGAPAISASELPQKKALHPEPVAGSSWLTPADVNPFESLVGTCSLPRSHFSHTPTTEQHGDLHTNRDNRRQHGLGLAEKSGATANSTHASTGLSSPDTVGMASSVAPLTIPPSSSTPKLSDHSPVAGTGSNVASGSGTGTDTGAGTGPTPLSNDAVKDSNHGAPTSSTTKAPISSSSPSTTSSRSRTSGTSSATAASPTVQEGFFNAITKRLQQVESNLTLSLKYVEDQSRHMQEALQRGEQKLHSRVSDFLNNLNQTVLADLRNIRDQYDQIWQSTVLALESQSERSERDMMALSTRLNLLADEVVFQKRMAIVQAVILLSCLFLVIFSRGVPIPYTTAVSDQSSPVSYLSSASLVHPYRDGYRTSQHHHNPREGVGKSHNDDLRFSSIDLSSQAQLQDPTSTTTTRRNSVPDIRHSPSEYAHFSPPLTPGLVSDDLRSLHNPDAGYDPIGEPCRNSIRRASSGMLQINSRKPLPSLPEHPSSLHKS